MLLLRFLKKQPQRPAACAFVLAAALFSCVAEAQTVTQVAITNPSFEGTYNSVNDDNGQVTGMVAAGWANNGGYGDVTAVYAQDTANPHSGASSQKISLSAVRSGNLQLLQNISLKGGSLYTVSMWVRSDTATALHFALQGPAPYYTQLLQGVGPTTTGWTKYSALGFVDSDQQAALIIAMNEPGTIYVDDVSVSYQPGSVTPAPNLGPIAPTFFGMHSADFVNRLFRNGGMEGPFRSAGISSSDISGDVATAWEDDSSWADVSVHYAQDVNSPHGGKSAQSVTVQAVRSGQVQLIQQMSVLPGQSYTLTAWVRGQSGMNANMAIVNAYTPYNGYAATGFSFNGKWQKYTISGVVNDSGRIILAFSGFSPGTFSIDDVTFTAANGKVAPPGAPLPTKPFGTLRLWDSSTTWSLLEPQRGVWDFSKLDYWVANAGGRDIILTLGQSPVWASSDPGNQSYYGAGASAPPVNMQDWVDYVTTVAQRYKGKIRFYEIWNEPNDANFYSGSVAQLAALTQSAYQTLKAIDPGNTVISAPAYEAGYLDLFFATGAARYIDVVGYHAYANPPEDTGRQLSLVRLMMAKYNLSAKPLWDTEAASGDGTLSDADATSYIVRKYLVDLMFGSGRLDWYTWGLAASFCVATEQSNQTQLTNAGLAYGYLYQWLSGASLTGAVIDSANNYQVWLKLSTGRQALIVWNPTTSGTFQIPSRLTAVQKRDIYGKTSAISGNTVTVTSAPILLVGNF